MRDRSGVQAEPSRQIAARPPGRAAIAGRPAPSRWHDRCSKVGVMNELRGGPEGLGRPPKGSRGLPGFAAIPINGFVECGDDR